MTSLFESCMEGTQEGGGVGQLATALSPVLERFRDGLLDIGSSVLKKLRAQAGRGMAPKKGVRKSGGKAKSQSGGGRAQKKKRKPQKGRGTPKKKQSGGAAPKKRTKKSKKTTNF